MVQLQTREMIQEGRGDIQGDVKDASEVLSCTLKCRRVNSHGGCGPLATGRHSPEPSLLPPWAVQSRKEGHREARAWQMLGANPGDV